MSLVWKNGRWVTDTTPAPSVVSFSPKITSPYSGQTLVFDGTNWINGTPVVNSVDGGNFDPLDGGTF